MFNKTRKGNALPFAGASKQADVDEGDITKDDTEHNKKWDGNGPVPKKISMRLNIHSNERQRERRKSVKRELNFAIKNAQRQNMQHQIFVDADYVRGKENTNTLEGIVQPKKKRGGALRNSQRNGKRRVSFSSSVYVHTIPRNK